MSLLNQLWILADEIYGSTNVAPGSLFGECGLFLQRPLKRWEYSKTPLNTLTFASTGGDGVHYGFLQLPPSSMEEQPVVMTVPGIGHNLVVAESFREFLGLGYFVGWFSLENLVYEQREAVEYFNQPDPDAWPEREEEIEVLRDRLRIEPIRLSWNRIEALNAKYSSFLQI